jgi:hypothetical protein
MITIKIEEMHTESEERSDSLLSLTVDTVSSLLSLVVSSLATSNGEIQVAEDASKGTDPHCLQESKQGHAKSLV